MFTRRYTSLVTAGILLASCNTPMATSTLISNKYLSAEPGEGANAKGVVRGVPYFLPRTVLPVTITGKFVAVRTLKPEEVNDPSLYEYTITADPKAASQAADPNQTLLLQYNQEDGTDDHFVIAVNDKGLLSNVDVRSEDKTSAILLKLVELAGAIAKAATGFVPSGLPASTMKYFVEKIATDEDKRRLACWQTLQPFTVDTSVDLSSVMSGNGATINTNLEDLSNRVIGAMFKPDFADNGKAAVAKWQTANKRHLFDISLSKSALGANDVASTIKQETRILTGRPGIVFRVVEPRDFDTSLSTSGVTVASKDYGDCKLTQGNADVTNKTYLVANPNKTISVDMGRDILVKKQIALAINDGVYGGVTIDKPSTALAVASLPVDLLKAILSIPAELLTFKVQQMSAETGLTTAETAKLNAELSLLKAQQDLENARKAAAGTN